MPRSRRRGRWSPELDNAALFGNRIAVSRIKFIKELMSQYDAGLITSVELMSALASVVNRDKWNEDQG